MPGHGRIEDRLAVMFECRQRACFVGGHKPAIANNICG
jgi:hypothetical protein